MFDASGGMYPLPHSALMKVGSPRATLINLGKPHDYFDNIGF